MLLAAAAPSAAGDSDISGLSWLSGCWAAIDGEAGSGEYWLMPAGGSMLGVNRTVRDNRTVAFEFLRIAETEDGSLVLTASPSGQAVTDFALSSRSEHQVVFENDRHDFPQRVIYRLLPDGVLLGRIEGRTAAGERQIDFPMTRVDCEGHFGEARGG
jgi:hypothetical protein